MVFKKVNYILLAVSIALIVLGFVLMLGVRSAETYNPAIYSSRYITIGPMISFFGFLLVIPALIYRKK
ncbi:MAG TPA: DUF3098 domain-containing protein [Bacteroidales bacterium]|jgi:hypothetical protein|nr:DUF3098 domain-containing protein [Bacteroidales bacterium]